MTEHSVADNICLGDIHFVIDPVCYSEEESVVHLVDVADLQGLRRYPHAVVSTESTCRLAPKQQ